MLAGFMEELKLQETVKNCDCTRRFASNMSES